MRIGTCGRLSVAVEYLIAQGDLVKKGALVRQRSNLRIGFAGSDSFVGYPEIKLRPPPSELELHAKMLGLIFIAFAVPHTLRYGFLPIADIAAFVQLGFTFCSRLPAF